MRAGRKHWPLALFLAMAVPAQSAGLSDMGRFVWDEDRDGFGGLSDLIMTDFGTRMTAISDQGTLFQAEVTRSAAGAISKVRLLRADRPLDNSGQPVSGFRQDAEDLTMGPDGMLYISFEGYARVAGFRPPDMTPRPMNRWDQFRDIWGNEGFEALATLPDGRLMTVIEVSQNGLYTTMMRSAEGWSKGPGIPVDGYWQASGADVGPDGKLYLLERDYSLVWGYSTRIRRFTLSEAGFDAGQTIYSTPDGGSENYEGISVWRDADGRLVASLISDNNLRPGTATVIAEFKLDG